MPNQATYSDQSEKAELPGSGTASLTFISYRKCVFFLLKYLFEDKNVATLATVLQTMISRYDYPKHTSSDMN